MLERGRPGANEPEVGRVVAPAVAFQQRGKYRAH
jgi:hypothetical protein